MISLSLDAFTPTTTPTREVPPHLRAALGDLLAQTEKHLNTRFKVVPATSFVATPEYRKHSQGQAWSETYVPEVAGRDMVAFAHDASQQEGAYLKDGTAQKVCEALGVKLLAVVRVKWSLVDLKDSLFEARSSGGASASIAVHRDCAQSEVWVTIYGRNGTKFLHETRALTSSTCKRADRSDQKMVAPAGARAAELATQAEDPKWTAAFVDASAEGVEAIVKTVKKWR